MLRSAKKNDAAAMPDCPYLLIHPLLDKDNRWSAFLCEVSGEKPIADADFARLIDDPHWRSLSAKTPWLVPAVSDLKVPIDPSREPFICIFRPLPPENPAALPLHELQQALQHSHRPTAFLCPNNGKLPTDGRWQYLLVPIVLARALPPFALLGQTGKRQVVAIDMRTHEDLHWARQNNCSLTSSESPCLNNPHSQEADVSRLKLLELLTLMSRDADTHELESVFRKEPKLAYSLLRLVNSAALSPGRTISGFAQAITLLGRRQLQRWLQLLVYADQNDGRGINPLLQKAAARGRLLELLSLEDGAQENDVAFMVGTFSLLDGLLNLPLAEVIGQLPLDETVRLALTTHDGQLGQCLHALILADQRETTAAADCLRQLDITPERFIAAQLAALHWASQLPHP